MHKENTFFEALKPFFEAAGFRPMPWFNQFQARIPGGYQNVFVLVSHYDDISLADVSFGLRINLVEETIMPYSNAVNGYKENANTCLTTMGRFRGKKYDRFRISSAGDWSRAQLQVEDFFTKEGFAELDRLSRLKALEATFNGEVGQSKKWSFNQQLHCFRGLALASLTQNPHWEKIYQDYRQSLMACGTPHLIMDRFQQLADRLAGMGLN